MRHHNSVLHSPHLPFSVPIDGYGQGGFRFAGMSHRGSLLCLPSGLYAWDATSPVDFTEDIFTPVLEEAGAIDLLLIGTGRESAPLARDLRMKLQAHGLSIDTMPTGAAAQTWNILLEEKRRVAAALIATV